MWSYILYLAALLLLSRPIHATFSRHLRERKNGYAPAPSYPQLAPLMGFDIAKSMASALKNHCYLQWLAQLHETAKAKTFSMNFLGTRTIHTIEAENLKALLSTVAADFGVEPLRRKNGVAMPFADKGANTTDGHDWEVGRNLIKPYFMKEAFSNTDRLEKHTDSLLSLIPEDGSIFDMQILLQRWFLDTSTEFMFGESIGCLQHPERADITWAMADVLRGLRLRLQMSKWIWLFRSQTWTDAVKVVHAFMDRHIDKTFKEMDDAQAHGKAGSVARASSVETRLEPERSDLLWHLANKLRDDRQSLRSHLCILFVPNNDTTSIFVSNVFWNLARHPDIYAKVRDEVLSHGFDAKLTYECLRSMKYLDAVLNETHRLYPISPSQVRIALKDSMLPVGGGKDGRSAIYVRKGDVVQVHKVVMFQDKEFWGEDAMEFKPERWQGLRPYWNFVPFGGGARRCPAQYLATTEASYMVARFARRFKAIENRDPSGYVAMMRVGAVNKNGVKISVTAV